MSLLTFLPLKGSNVKRLAIWLLSVAVTFLIGCAIGLFIHPFISHSNHGEQAEIVDSLSRTMNELREKEEDLRLKDENACLKDSVKKLTEQIAKTVDKAKGPKPEPEQNVDAERASLIKKLRGTAFTKADIEKLKQKQPTNEEKNLIRSCEACLRLINYDIFNKEKVVKLIKDRESTGVNDHDERFIEYMYHNIIDVHKKAMDKIIKDYSKVYVTIDRINFKTLDEALDIYRSAYGGLYYE